MEKKTHKKPKHTSLVVPGTEGKSKKGGRRVYSGAARPRAKQPAAGETRPSAQAGPVPAAKAPAQKAMAFQTENTISIERPKDLLQAARRRRSWRKVRTGLLFVFVIWLTAFFATGAYFSAWVALNETITNAKIALQPGNGFPMEFAVSGYKDVQPMGTSGFAVLAEKDVSVVSSTGRELLRAQHGFVNPYITTNKNRVCVYNRGGTEYLIEGRTSEFYAGTAADSILFAQLSPGGSLALCTAGRASYLVSVYGPTMTEDPVFKWSSSSDIPVRVAFHSDNKSLAIGTISARGGAMGSTVYLFRTDRAESKAQTAAISVEDAIPLQIHYISASQVLVLYNTGYAAVYSTTGEELYRYSYAGRSLYAASVGNKVTALVFGAESQDSAELVLLSRQLEQLAEVSAEGVSNAQVIAADKGAFLLAGQEVLAYSLEGVLTNTIKAEKKPYGLVYAGVPLLVQAGGVQQLSLTQPTAQQGGQSAVSSGQPASNGAVSLSESGS